MSLISIRHLSKGFAELAPLKDVNCEIEQGEVISIIGPSGTGKSLMLRCLTGLEKVEQGEIFLDGENILAPGVDLSKVRQKMGLVFQDFNLFAHFMVIEHLMIGPMYLKGVSRQEAYDKGMELLRSVGMAERAFAYPDELSGGQQQRVAIARTLSMEPEIILFDEPTSALDPAMVGEVVSVLRKLAAKKMTMMVVTHEMRLARDISTRIFYMDEGGIYEEGTPAQIFDHPQREKTRLFIRQLKPFHYEIKSRDFDFLGINSEIEHFGQKVMAAERIRYHCQSLFEELFVACILPRLPQRFDAALDLGWSEWNMTMEFRLCYAGDGYNPLEDEETDPVAMLLIRKMAPELQYRCEDGVNFLETVLTEKKK